MSEQRRRVLHVRSSGGMLGAEQVVLALCRHSGAYGYDPVLAVTHDRGDAAPELCAAAAAGGVPVHVIECRHRFDLRAITQLTRLLTAHEVDVLHCHGYREDFYAVAARADVKRVTTNHLWKRTTPALRLYAAADAWLARRFDRVVAVSHEILRELEAKGLRAPQLTYVPNGVDTDRYRPKAHNPAELEARRARVGVSGHDIVLTTIGSLTEEKGHEHLFRAIAALNDRNLRLIVAGDGPRREHLVRLAQDLGIAQAVKFLGRRDDVADILSIADLFVLPSLIEGLPIALLEAMACERACIATDVGDVAEAIEPGMTGMLVRRTDSDRLAASIATLAKDAQLRARLGKAARQRVVERFSARRMAEAYCSVYDELVTEP